MESFPGTDVEAHKPRSCCNLAAAQQERKKKLEFFVWYVKQFPNWPAFKVLDFGCGHGEGVELMREEGIQCYGADVFYEGDLYEDVFRSDLFQRQVIRRIGKDWKIPFVDGFFDLVFSNQVMEHIEYKDMALRELGRVTRVDGVILLKFPTQETIFEGHICLPFVHWFPKGRLRRSYVVLMR